MMPRLFLILLLAAPLSGCTFFPARLHPGNLWKLNGHEPGGRDSMYFSVPDPVRRRVDEADAPPARESAPHAAIPSPRS